jgi:phosphate/sulfate permease
VANAIGPLAGVLSVIKSGVIETDTHVPMLVLLLGGIGIVVGLATWGWRVIETIGKCITELTPTRGFAAEFGAAITIVLASKLALPVSTTHTLVGAVLGVGLARGLSSLNLSTIRDIFISWVITIPAGAAITILFYYIIKLIFS